MKKMLRSAFVLATMMAIPASAMALDTSRAFAVNMLGAQDHERYAGRWYFSFDSSVRYACNYAVEWESPSGLISTDCVFQEMKVHGRKSCLRNAVKNFSTLVTLDNDDVCQGFAGDTGLLQDVLFLVLGESAEELNGVVLLDGPTGTLHGIVARALPPDDDG
jgi:hypothetical protein